MSNTQSHLIVTEEGLKIYKDDPSSAILCEDQERAMDLIHEIEYQKWRANGKYIIKIGSIYPVPGIEFEEVVIGSDCKRQYENPPSLCGTVNNCDCPPKTVARLIEHTAEKEDPDRMFKEWIGESPEIDKEEENSIYDEIWNAGEMYTPAEFKEYMKKHFNSITRKP